MKMPPGTKVTVLGLRDTGFLSALFLHEKGYQVFASDLADTEDVRRNVETLAARGIHAECGKHTLDVILSADGFLISPGIPPGSNIYQAILASKKQVFSEIEVASWFCVSPKVIAVTGSSGKTTVTTLMARVLEKEYGKSFLCGNIGNPWIGEISKITAGDFVVIEISSLDRKSVV